ncbi:hypothetical protein LTR53_013031 [Teratosphaeriaceae sp. CCFEE 6253]|nr:hypothetical protein LTR53_013031 [Teratosphaeriaceae sp. CCFEE 6253]
MSTGPEFKFDYDLSLADFAVSKHAYLAADPGSPFSLIATSTLVLDNRVPANSRILLLQRGASDYHPHRWEPPGGACDD